MKITSADLAYYRPANDSRPQTAPAASPVSARAVPPVDPFEACRRRIRLRGREPGRAATLRRDQQQMLLAEMADVRAQGSVSVQAAAAAYHEFDA